MDSKTLHIKPATGQRVRDPLTGQLLNVSGETKPSNSYWWRRLQDGSVVEVTATKTSTSKPAAKPDTHQESD